MAQLIIDNGVMYMAGFAGGAAVLDVFSFIVDRLRMLGILVGNGTERQFCSDFVAVLIADFGSGMVMSGFAGIAVRAVFFLLSSGR